MEIHDRGTMKWTSLMLPEHVRMLREMWDDTEYKEMPILDEQQIAENNLLLQEALEYDLLISIKHYYNHEHVIEKGYLLGIDGIRRVIYMEETEIKFDDVIEVNIM